jgi:hypothetical protein
VASAAQAACNLQGVEEDSKAAAPVQQSQADQQQTLPAAEQPQQQGSEVSTAAAKLVAEIVASPIFYLVAGGSL